MAHGKFCVCHMILIVFLAFDDSLTAAAGDFIILQSSKDVHFLPDASPIAADEIAPIIAASFGLPFQKNVKWDGLQEGSLFQRPKANVLISVSGISHGQLEIKHEFHYKTTEADGGLNVDDLVDHIRGLEWKNEPLLVEFSADEEVFAVRSHYTELFANLPTTLAALNDDVTNNMAQRWFSSAELKSLNVSQPVDFFFLSELYMMQEIINTLLDNKAAIKTYSPDFFHFSISGLEQLVDMYGLDSPQFTDALTLLKTVSQHVTAGLKQLYDDNIVIELVTLPAGSQKPPSRHSRSLLADKKKKSEDKKNPLNRAPRYSKDYPVIFHILLWSSLGLGLCVWFTSYAIWYMDPGRDSIIYRMTSQRMKRD